MDDRSNEANWRSLNPLTPFLLFAFQYLSEVTLYPRQTQFLRVSDTVVEEDGGIEVEMRGRSESRFIPGLFVFLERKTETPLFSVDSDEERGLEDGNLSEADYMAFAKHTVLLSVQKVHHQDPEVMKSWARKTNQFSVSCATRRGRVP